MRTRIGCVLADGRPLNGTIPKAPDWGSLLGVLSHSGLSEERSDATLKQTTGKAPDVWKLASHHGGWW